MNFRDICQLAVKEAGVKDGGPSTVIGQSGILGLFVTWVQQAWVELWYEQEWKFRWKRATTTLTAGTAEYATLPGLSDVDRVFAYEIWNASVTPQQRLRYVDHSVIDQAEVMSDTVAYFSGSRTARSSSPNSSGRHIGQARLPDVRDGTCRRRRHPSNTRDQPAPDHRLQGVDEVRREQRGRGCLHEGKSEYDTYFARIAKYLPDMDCRPLPVTSVPDNYPRLV